MDLKKLETKLKWSTVEIQKKLNIIRILRQMQNVSCFDCSQIITMIILSNFGKIGRPKFGRGQLIRISKCIKNRETSISKGGALLGFGQGILISSDSLFPYYHRRPQTLFLGRAKISRGGRGREGTKTISSKNNKNILFSLKT